MITPGLFFAEPARATPYMKRDTMTEFRRRRQQLLEVAWGYLIGTWILLGQALVAAAQSELPEDGES